MLLPLAVCLALSLGAIPADRQTLTVTMIAHAAVHITDGKGAVLVDFPYDPGTVFAPWSPEGVPRGPKPLCIITHGHPDHFDPEMAPKFCGAILGPKDLAATGKVRRIELQPVVNWNGVSINAFTTPHDPEREHYSYLLEWHGVRLYFTGDTDNLDSLLAAHDLDAAFVTPSLLIALKRQGAHLDARQIISYHHHAGDPVPDFQGRIISHPGQVLKLSAK
jgi:hypothetical protein